MQKKEEKPINSMWGYLFLAALVLFFGILIVDRPEAKGEFEATIVGIHQVQSDVPKPPKLVVEFDDGHRVILGKRSQKVLRKIGARVLVRKYERNILGTVHFRFVKFIDN